MPEHTRARILQQLCRPYGSVYHRDRGENFDATKEVCCSTKNCNEVTTQCWRNSCFAVWCVETMTWPRVPKCGNEGLFYWCPSCKPQMLKLYFKYKNLERQAKLARPKKRIELMSAIINARCDFQDAHGNYLDDGHRHMMLQLLPLELR